MKRALKWTLWTVLVLVTLATAAWTVLNVVGERRLHAQTRLLEEQGFMRVTVDAVPADLNAAPFFKAAFALLPPDPPLTHDAAEKGWAGATRSGELREWIAASSDALDLIRKGRLRGTGRYDRDYEAGFEMRLDEVAPTVRAMRLCAIRAEMLQADGAGAAARESVRDLLSLAEALNEPVLVCQLVRLVGWELALSGIARMATADDAGAWLEILPPVSRFDGMMASAFQGELRSAARLLASVDTFHRLSRGAEVPPWAWLLNPWVRLDGADYLEHMARWVELARRPVWELHSSVEGVGVNPNAWGPEPVKSVLMPAFKNVFRNQGRLQARLAVVRAGLGSRETLDPWTGGSLVVDAGRISSAAGIEWKKR